MNDITKTGEPVVAVPGVEAAKPYEGWSGDEILQTARERELVPDLRRARSFLRLIGDDTVLCHLNPDGGPMLGLRGLNAVDQALSQNQQGRAVYFTLNAVKPGVVKKAAKTDITTIRGVSGDIDWGWEKFSGRFEEGLAVVATKLQELMGMDLPPSVIILTGGGVQPIWLIEPMLATEPNASRAEAVGAYVTQRFGGDPVQNIDRVLRMPGFINHPNAKKRRPGQPPMTATLIYPGRVIRYTLARLEQAWGVAARADENTNSAGGLHHENRPREGKTSAAGVDAHGLPLSELDDLTGGMKQNYAPADIDAVAKCCPFIRDTLATGGAGYKEPLWKQTLALAARCKDPEDTAHRLSRGHVGYAREATEQKLAQNHGAGPPLCETIHKLNVPQCKTCVYRILGTTPLNIGTFTSPDAPLVEGKPLVTKLPPQVLWDSPGNRANIMAALDRRLSADPYTFQNGDRLISLRVSPGSAQFANIIDRRRSATGEVIATPAVRDDGDMPAMLETTDADILLIADQDYWMGTAQGRPSKDETGEEKPKHKRVHASADTCKIYMKSSRTKIGFRPLLGLARVPIIDKEGGLAILTSARATTRRLASSETARPSLNVPDRPTNVERLQRGA